MDDQLFHIALSGDPVLTVNKRLSRALMSAFEERMLREGHTAWPTPSILPFDAWLQEQVRRLGQGGRLLNDAQAQYVWESIIEKDLADRDFPVFQVAATARKARSAHRLLRQFDATFRADHGSADHKAFLRWQQQWTERLDAEKWDDPVDSTWLVASAIAGSRLNVPDRLVLAGFDDLTPDIKAVRSALDHHGCEVFIWLAEIDQDAERIRFAAVDCAEEVRSCARWARHLVLNGAERIGIVSPDLESYRSLIDVLFRAELDPPAVLSGNDEPEPYNLSLGGSLDEEGVVCAALRLLQLRYQVDFDEISWLLRSPYLGGAVAERSARGRVERKLRETGQTSWPLAALVRWLKDAGGVPRLVALFESVQTQLRQNPSQTAGAWAETFAEELSAVGWPGDRSPGSREYQVLQHFQESLARLTSLDRVAKPMKRSAALSALGRLAREAIFQPKTPDSPIQVLGLLEAAGMTFDHLWILGLHDQALPAPPQPNPFLPLALQRQHGMPHADADRERLFADRVIRRLFGAAPRVVASHPGQVDGAERRASPYLDEIISASPEMAVSVDPACFIHQHHPELEIRNDDRGAPLVSRKPFSGGTAILKDQALCPFRAFAHHRLRASGLEIPDVGIDNMARGTLVHTTLELFWNEVASQEALLALDDDAQRMLMERCSQEALQRLERSRRRDLPSNIKRLEQARLVALGLEWLEIERDRPSFTVAEQETLHQEQIGRITIRTRIDRVDRLEDGRRVIIDYKTGRTEPSRWVGERVTEPQLPIYCLSLAPEDVAAVLFAATRAGDCRFRGLARSPADFRGLTERTQGTLLNEMGLASFDDVLDHWQERLPQLGDEFADGVAVVDPVDEEQACRYCDLVSLCRIRDHLKVDNGEGDHD